MDDQSLSTRARATLTQNPSEQPSVRPPVRRIPRQYQPISSDPAASFQSDASSGMSAQVKRQVRQRPWMAFGIALVAGYTLANITDDDDDTDAYRTTGATARSYTTQAVAAASPQPRQSAQPVRPASFSRPNDVSAHESASAYHPASAPPAKPGLLTQLTSQFDDQFAEIKGTAVTTLLGLVRDTIKQNIPALHQELEHVRAQRGQPASAPNAQPFSTSADSFASNRGDL